MSVPNPSEQIQVVNLPAGAAPPAPPENPYDYGADSGFDPELDTAPEPGRKATPAPAEPAAAPAKPHAAPPVPKHPRGLVNRALRYGATQSQIDNVSTDELDAWVEQQDIARDRERESALNQADTRRAATNPKGGDQGQGGPPSSAPAPAEPADDDALLEQMEKDYGLDPRMKAMLKRHAAEIKEARTLKDTVKDLAAREEGRQRDQAEDACDRAFRSLGEGYAKVLGEKDGADYQPADPQMQRRIDILRAAGVDMARDKPAQIEKKVRAAAERLYRDLVTTPETGAAPNAYEAAAEEAEEGKAPRLGQNTSANANGGKRITNEQWNKAGLTKPTSRARKEPPSKDRAARAVASAMKEKGIRDEDFDSLMEEEGLPD